MLRLGIDFALLALAVAALTFVGLDSGNLVLDMTGAGRRAVESFASAPSADGALDSAELGLSYYLRAGELPGELQAATWVIAGCFLLATLLWLWDGFLMNRWLFMRNRKALISMGLIQK